MKRRAAALPPAPLRSREIAQRLRDHGATEQEILSSDEWIEAYVAERNQAASLRIFGDPDDKDRRPLTVANVKAFNPHRW